MAAASQIIKARKLSGGRFSPAQTAVVVERELAVRVNGSLLFTASITPGLEKEFVAGYLYGQGFIDGVSDIKEIAVDGEGARVTLKNPLKETWKASYRIVSGGGKMAFLDGAQVPQNKSDLKIGREVIFRAMSALFSGAKLYEETEGVHAAALFDTHARPICIAEDIGRHNTLDKVTGYALLNGIDCRNALLVSTGRMTSEMVMKICRAGIPVAATKTAVTDKGLEISRKCGLTLIGFVRDKGTTIHTDMEVRVSEKTSMKIYCGAFRII
jgi:FdhD protein